MTILSNSFQSQPPPPYADHSTTTNLTPITPSLLNLPDHLILEILSYFDLVELHFKIKILNKKLEIYSKNLLRLKLLPSYLIKIKNNFSSDPLSLTTFNNNSSEFSQEEEKGVNFNRESKILDLFIGSVCQKLLLLNESSLHLILELNATESAERDLFNLLQPKTRIEDLLILIGKSIGLVINSSSFNASSSDNGIISKGRDETVGIIREQDISVDLTGKSVKLLLPFESSSSRGRIVNKGVVEVNRTEKDSLEGIAERLLDKLSSIRLVREGNSSTCWYRKL